MIKTIKEKLIQCNNCRKLLTHPDDYPLISHQGMVVREDTDKNIEIVAQEFGWKIEGSTHLCPTCQ